MRQAVHQNRPNKDQFWRFLAVGRVICADDDLPKTHDDCDLWWIGQGAVCVGCGAVSGSWLFVCGVDDGIYTLHELGVLANYFFIIFLIKKD